MRKRKFSILEFLFNWSEGHVWDNWELGNYNRSKLWSKISLILHELISLKRLNNAL